MSSLKTFLPDRILALDYLRGFFIIIIIVDHLWRWPNLFVAISGRGELWASAAQGFVIISGLLVGYIRGYKNRQQSLKIISKILVKRGFLLYFWMILTTIILTMLSWFLHFKGGIPWIPISIGDWNNLFISAVRLDYTHTLTHFLYLYALFLILSPLAIQLLRKRLPWLLALASLAGWAFGILRDVEWLQWQLLFFIPVIAGFYMESLAARYARLPKYFQTVVRIVPIAITTVTATISAVLILPSQPGAYTSTLFSKDPVTMATIVMSFIWFLGFLSLFQYCLPFLQKRLHWLLLPFGERSLTAYILHTLPLILCQILFPESSNIFINTTITATCIIMTLLLVRLPFINRIVPR